MSFLYWCITLKKMTINSVFHQKKFAYLQALYKVLFLVSYSLSVCLSRQDFCLNLFNTDFQLIAHDSYFAFMARVLSIVLLHFTLSCCLEHFCNFFPQALSHIYFYYFCWVLYKLFWIFGIQFQEIYVISSKPEIRYKRVKFKASIIDRQEIRKKRYSFHLQDQAGINRQPFTK